MLDEDRIRILHMLDAAKETQEFIKDKTPDNLVIDRMLLLSLVKNIEIII